MKTKQKRKKVKGFTLLTTRGHPPRFTGRAASGVFIADLTPRTVTAQLTTATALVVVSTGTF